MRMQIMPLLGTGCLALVTGVSGTLAARTVTSPLPELPVIDSTISRDQPASPSNQRPDRARSDTYYASVTERPLFAPTRRPLVPNTIEIPVAEPEPAQLPEVSQDGTVERPDLKLHGTMITNDGFTALLSRAEGAPEWLGTGTDIQGWTLEEIGDGWATFQNGSQILKLEMY